MTEECPNAIEYSACQHGTVRLVGGVTEREGRVEICIGGVWGTVCDRGFGSYNGRVICRQLGYDPESGYFGKLKACLSALNSSYDIKIHMSQLYYVNPKPIQPVSRAEDCDISMFISWEIAFLIFQNSLH